MTSYDLHETSMKYHAMETTFAPFSSSSPHGRQHAVDQVAGMLRAGKVYRREDLARVSNAVDRHLGELVAAGALKRLAQGLYYAPKRSVFGVLPPDDHELVAVFLRDDDFLVFSPSMYNTLGLGTSQLYNKTLVYNHKRHGLFAFGNRQFDFRVKSRFPRQLTPEFLFVDALNNLDELAEDKHQVLQMAERKHSTFDPTELMHAVLDYGSVATQKRFKRWLNV
jgi:hypothetical protein